MTSVKITRTAVMTIGGACIMKLAFSTLACPEWSWDRVLNNAARLGFDGIEIRGIESEMNLDRIEALQPEQVVETKSRLKKLSLEVCCLGTSATFHDPKVYDRAIKEGRDSIDIAQRLGVPYIRIFGDRIPDPARKQETIEIVARGFGELATYAEQTGVTVLIETHGDFSNSDALLEVLERTKGTAKGVIWDINHPYKLAGEPMAQTYSKLSRYIKHAHIKDTIGEGYSAKHCLVGQGDVPVKEVVDLLRQGGYDGWLSFEFEKRWHPEIEEPEVALSAYVQYMRSII